MSVTSTGPDCAAVAETRLLHKMHRTATTLLARAAGRHTSPPDAVRELRDFLVAALRHHHESEDDLLWPRLREADPRAGTGLVELSTEHDALDAALDRLDAAAVPSAELAEAAVVVRDLVHRHLDSEEPLLFPVLAEHFSDVDWAAFSRLVIASAPPVGAHLNFGFFEQVGTPEELAVIAENLPPEVRTAVPALREQALATLRSLDDTHQEGTVEA